MNYYANKKGKLLTQNFPQKDIESRTNISIPEMIYQQQKCIKIIVLAR